MLYIFYFNARVGKQHDMLRWQLALGPRGFARHNQRAVEQRGFGAVGEACKSAPVNLIPHTNINQIKFSLSSFLYPFS